MEGNHFEVHADNGRGWSVQAVLDDANAAKARATEIKETTKVIAVKVLRVGYDQRKGEFVEAQVMYLGERRPDVIGKNDMVDGGPICTTGEQLYRPEARRAIRRFLKTWLDQVKVTPIELLHHAELFLKLDNSGTMLQGGMQRAAIAQARQSGENVQARQRELFRVVDEAVAAVRAIWRNQKRPKLEDLDLDAFVAALPDGSEDTLLINVALTERLQDYKTSGEKLEALLDMLGRAASPAVIALLDDYLTDFIEDSVFMRVLLGDDSRLGDALLRGLTLLSGNGQSVPGIPEKYQGFVRKLDSRSLPQCRKTLMRRAITTLASQHPLTSGAPVEEIGFNVKLHAMLRREKGGFVGGDEMHEAFLSRSDRFVTADAIGRITAGMDRPDERLGALLDIAPGIFGERNKRRLGEFISAIVTQPDNQRELAEDRQPPALRMRSIAELQRRVGTSGLPDFQTSRIAKALDDICVRAMEAENVLERLVTRSQGRAAACLSLLQLCAGGTFTQGQAIERAHLLVDKLLRSSGMIEELLEGADGADEKRRRLIELHDLIDRAELPDSPASAALASAIG